jgi:YfiH family protein
MNTDTKKLYKVVDRGDVQYLTMPAIEEMTGVLHAFTTRRNGLGARNNGTKQAGDWHPVAGAFGIKPDHLITVNQVHGENIVTIDAQGLIGGRTDPRTVAADAMITTARGIAIGVETADCVPILLFDPRVPAIAAVHAGWRSTVKKIVQKAVKRMQEEFGADPSAMIAAIGPAIGPECYEVDEPVMTSVRDAFSFWKEIAKPKGDDRWNLDLVKANRLELMQIGLSERNIQSVGMCTSCRKDLFYSFRAEGRTGRMLSVIMLKP